MATDVTGSWDFKTADASVQEVANELLRAYSASQNVGPGRARDLANLLVRASDAIREGDKLAVENLAALILLRAKAAEWTKNPLMDNLLHELITLRGKVAYLEADIDAGRKRESDLNRKAGNLEAENVRLRQKADQGLANTADARLTQLEGLTENLRARNEELRAQLDGCKVEGTRLRERLTAADEAARDASPLVSLARRVCELAEARPGNETVLRVRATRAHGQRALLGAEVVEMPEFLESAETADLRAREQAVGRRILGLAAAARDRDQVLTIEHVEEPSGRVLVVRMGAATADPVAIGDGVALAAVGRTRAETGKLAQNARLFSPDFAARLEATLRHRPPVTSASRSCIYADLTARTAITEREVVTLRHALLAARGTCACRDCTAWRRSYGITERRPLELLDLARVAERQNPSGPCPCGAAREVADATWEGYRVRCPSCSSLSLARVGFTANPVAGSAVDTPPTPAPDASQSSPGGAGEAPEAAPAAWVPKPGDEVWDRVTKAGPWILVQPQNEGFHADARRSGDKRRESVKVELAWVVATPEGLVVLPEAQLAASYPADPAPVATSRRRAVVFELLAASLATAIGCAGAFAVLKGLDPIVQKWRSR